MRGAHILVSLAALAALAVPSVALAGGAGDDQYLDPLEGLTGSNGGNTANPKDKPKKSSGTQSSGSPSAPVAVQPATETTAQAVAAKPDAKPVAVVPIKRPALDVGQLSGIGSLVAVPVKHVTLVIGDIAHERG
jgi:hypothetical protein